MNSLKHRLKSWRHQALQHYHEAVHGFDSADLRRALDKLGLRTGDCVLVHSALDAFPGFRGKPSEVIALLQAQVGDGGHVMMPTMAFTSTAVDFVKSGVVLDVQRTPSKMGLLTELFRRMPSVVRSIHPTHPIAVWGRDAERICADHHSAATPCGRPSPFSQLLDRDGKILLLGPDIDVLTFYHYVEEVLEARFPHSPFTAQRYDARVRDRSGNEIHCSLRLFEPAMSRRRDLQLLKRAMIAAKVYPVATIGGTQVALLSAKAVLDTVADMANRGLYCYD